MGTDGAPFCGAIGVRRPSARAQETPATTKRARHRPATSLALTARRTRCVSPGASAILVGDDRIVHRAPGPHKVPSPHAGANAVVGELTSFGHEVTERYRDMQGKPRRWSPTMSTHSPLPSRSNAVFAPE